MITLHYFRHKIALTLTLFSTFLSLLFSLLVWFGIEKSDDNAREALLSSHAERLIQYYQETQTLWSRDQLTGIDILVEGRDDIPNDISEVPPGYSENGDTDLYIYKTSVPAKTKDSSTIVYLVHEGSGKDWSEQYEHIVLLLLATVTLLVIVIGSLVGIALSNKISSPLQVLTQRIKSTDPNAPAFSPLEREDEFGEISLAFSNTLERINEVLEREKQFSRYASHELRTPVAIINSSLNLWSACEEEENREQAELIKKRAIERISVATAQMEDVIQTFLVLGKEGADWDESAPSYLHTQLDELLEKYQHLSGASHIILNKHYVDRSAQVTQVTAVNLVLSNALRNAFDYCASEIRLDLDASKLTITNDIDTLRVERADHFGFGIKIIEDLCDILNWRFQYEYSKSGSFKIQFDFG